MDRRSRDLVSLSCSTFNSTITTPTNTHRNDVDSRFARIDMFRKPRDDNIEAQSLRLGRPPTPPATPNKTPFTLAIPPSVPAPKMAVTKARTPGKQVPLPVIGGQGTVGRKSANGTKPKQNGKPNGSILSFFKKAEDDEQSAEGLFVQERGRYSTIPSAEYIDVSLSNGQCDSGVDEETRFHEVQSSSKRRKVQTHEAEGENEVDNEADLFGESPQKQTPSLNQSRSGPFLEYSDSEEDGDENPEAMIALAPNQMTAIEPIRADVDTILSRDDSGQIRNTPVTACEFSSARALSPTVKYQMLEEATDLRDNLSDLTRSDTRPPIIKEETSMGQEDDEFRDFEGADDFDEDIYEEGDEFLERRYMEEQAQIEAENAGVPVCPICEGSLIGLSEQETGVHVNRCLDGEPSTLTPIKTEQVSESPELDHSRTDSKPSTPGSQFKRTPRPPRPGQANPFVLGKPSTSGESAFAKLMSGHAEDAAWAEAAASEYAARGKPSYQRTCPFYKILPGLFICVDAFRYGAVAGCQAYFLSHFHSDHYIGLTSSWSHGPIYCSHVTANLVRQQLRVDPKYVVDLDFEQPFEVPGTKGVIVTMISANHCPGSSLYLFEKSVGKRNNGEPKIQRILHCGDFRACRKHLEHPLLMPEVKDRISGKLREQKIDVCYLDTTYLNPKYAFPGQEMVIKACADMCVSLSKHTVDEDDGWEQMKRHRAGEGMVKFVQRESSDIKLKQEADGDQDDQADQANMKVETNPHASQQILSSSKAQRTRGRLLVVVGTYSIGKERICLGIARALDSKIYAPPSKQRIVAALEDPELNERLTTDPRAAQVHMTPLFEIRAETLDDYLKDYFPHFTRAVGFRPSGWNYRPPNTRFLESPAVQTVLNSDNWKSAYSMRDLVPQRGSSSRASCFGVPYSEHSSFRELTMFCCGLRIEKIIPTVNVGSAKSREKMKAWCERWAQDRKKNGLWQLPEDGSW